MKNMKHMLRVSAASMLALVLAVSPMSAAAGETELQGNLETILESSEELLETTSEQLQGAYEGYIRIQAEDPMRAVIAQAAGGTDDMSWVQNAGLLMQEAPNESGGADMEATLLFNDTELYHLQISYDAAEKTVYAVCPELLDKAMAIPVEQLSESAQDVATTHISPEILMEAGSLLDEFSDFVGSIPPEMLQEEAMNYIGTLGSHIVTEQGIATVTAGTLSQEANTSVFRISAEDMKEMIPQLLKLLSEDQLLEQALKSEFVTHILNLAARQGGMGMELSGEDILTLIQSYLSSAADQDYSGVYGFCLTIGTADDGTPVKVSLALETSGVTAELFSLDAVEAGPDHAVEFKLGQVLAGAMGPDASAVSGIVIQGTKADYPFVSETLSVKANGVAVPVFQITDLDVEDLGLGLLTGKFTFYGENMTVACDFHRSEEDGGRQMDLYVNDDLWCAVTLNLYEAESVDIDPIDTSDAMPVYDEESLAAYMRDTNVTKMIEKLADAGVPQEYVDKLTSSEASTESSRENVEEADPAA